MNDERRAGCREQLTATSSHIRSALILAKRCSISSRSPRLDHTGTVKSEAMDQAKVYMWSGYKRLTKQLRCHLSIPYRQPLVRKHLSLRPTSDHIPLRRTTDEKCKQKQDTRMGHLHNQWWSCREFNLPRPSTPRYASKSHRYLRGQCLHGTCLMPPSRVGHANETAEGRFQRRVQHACSKQRPSSGGEQP